MKLSPKHRRFVAEYLKDQNATQAAIRAGYKKKNADVVGPRLLGNVGIKAAIEAALTKAEDKAVVTVAYVLTTLKEVVERCMTHTPVMEFDYEAKELVQKKKSLVDADGNLKRVGVFEFDSAGANGALKMLGQHLKMFTERSEVTGANGQPLVPKQDAPVTLINMNEYSKEVLQKILATIKSERRKPANPGA